MKSANAKPVAELENDNVTVFEYEESELGDYSTEDGRFKTMD